MPPKLIAISGPLQGKTFTFSEAAEVSIGRDPSNHLCLSASTVSRWHCLIKVDIRVIAATNRDLEAGIKAGGFRSDLYYRLNVISLKMPSLRERREDIRLLANHFLKKHSQRCKRQVRGISDEAHALLRSYDWPGNVRELENAIERALVLGSTDLIRPEDLPEALLESESPTRLPLYEAVKEAKKRFILQAIEQADGNYTEAAKILGIHPNHVHRLLRELKLRK